MKPMWLLVRVKAYAGYKADERPESFEYKGVERFVEEILDRWYGESDDYFKVRSDDGKIYTLRCHRPTTSWFLAVER